MYTNELLPQCIIMGISPGQFWKMNPRLLKPYQDAERLRQEILDDRMWVMGKYVCEAVGVAVYNNLKPKGKKTLSYLDKPLLKQVKEERGEFTEEEKMQKVRAIFNALQIMKVNYDLEKKQKGA